MDYNAAFQISASGMAVEKMRLDVTAANIANMNSLIGFLTENCCGGNPCVSTATPTCCDTESATD